MLESEFYPVLDNSECLCDVCPECEAREFWKTYHQSSASFKLFTRIIKSKLKSTENSATTL